MKPVLLWGYLLLFALGPLVLVGLHDYHMRHPQGDPQGATVNEGAHDA